MDEPTWFIFVLNAILLVYIHNRASLMQVLMLDWAELKLLGGALSALSVSSAYLW